MKKLMVLLCEHVKATIVCVLMVAGTLLPALAQGPSQPLVKIRWQTEIKRPLDAADSQLPPSILYEKAPTATNTTMKMRLEYSFTTTSGEKSRQGLVMVKSYEFPEPSGLISDTSWYDALVMLKYVYRGTGTVYIAFFEPPEKESPRKDELGRQLSNWLELPITLPDPEK